MQRASVIMGILENLGINEPISAVVRQYLELPDNQRSGIGMVAGGSLSPLIGALYLLPLDQAMHMYATKSGIFYVRYMDDIIVLAKKNWHLRTAIAIIQTTTVFLGLKMHKKTKCFIG